jgi:membrane-bound serine protease (ClpP class)
MRTFLVWLLSAASLLASDAPPISDTPTELAPRAKKVCIIPIREAIYPPMLYMVRRGVKEAIDRQADLLVLDMETPGGRVDTTREIIEILDQFKGDTATFVNKDAFSAGAFIAVATKRIYMAPGGVIGAAAPIILSPSGGGPTAIPDTYEKKMTSAVRAMVRATAEKNGYNLQVVEAMIDKSRGLTIDGNVIAKEGEILTLTNTEAEKEYGNPPTKLLSSGTVANMDALLAKLGYAGASRIVIESTGLEKLGSWLNAISPLLLFIGMLGLYLEVKTPGASMFGIIGVTAFILYFLGGYAAGISGFEWVVLFIIGIALIAVELFFYPGTLALGIGGAVLVLISIVMAMVDLYPNPGPGPGLPRLPSFDPFQMPLQQLVIAMASTGVAVWLLSRILPKTHIYQSIISTSASGVQTEVKQEEQRTNRLGQTGRSLSSLRPGGKAQFGEDILDVMTQGELLPKGTHVRIIGFSGTEAVVEAVKPA